MGSCSSDPELIRLDVRPPAFAFMVSIDGISPITTYDKLKRCLAECGGLVDNLTLNRVLDEHDQPTRQYALAQFYCASECERCRHELPMRYIDGNRVTVRRYSGSAAATSGAATPRLTIAKAIDVMDHFVGFNQWAHELLELESAAPAYYDQRGAPRPPATGAELQVAAAAEQKARVRVHVRSSGLAVEGMAVHKAEPGGGGGAAAESLVERLAWTKKAAVSHAVLAALATLAIVRLPSGKVLVRRLDGGGENVAPNLGPVQRKISAVLGTLGTAAATAVD